jgi:glycosyltransferase involved in cell wall biosynthesis
MTEWGGVSVVVPVFGDGAALRELVARTNAALEKAGEDWEIILVNDGSPGPAWDRIRELASSSPRVRGIDLVRNFGQHNALLAGIRASRGEVIVTMDDDLQHPPEEMPLLIRGVRGGADVVYGTPRELPHEVWRNATSVVGKAIISTVFGASMARQISAFRAFRGALRRVFEEFRSPYVSIDVLLSWGAVRVVSVTVTHMPRSFGRSQYTFRKLLHHWLDMVMGFSTWPLRAASILGFVFLLFGGGVLAWVLGRYLVSGGSVPGFPFLACIITIFSGVQLFSLGVIGEYVARLYARGLDRPPYVIASRVNFGNG